MSKLQTIGTLLLLLTTFLSLSNEADATVFPAEVYEFGFQTNSGPAGASTQIYIELASYLSLVEIWFDFYNSSGNYLNSIQLSYDGYGSIGQRWVGTVTFNYDSRALDNKFWIGGIYLAEPSSTTTLDGDIVGGSNFASIYYLISDIPTILLVDINKDEIDYDEPLEIHVEALDNDGINSIRAVFRDISLTIRLDIPLEYNFRTGLWEVAIRFNSSIRDINFLALSELYVSDLLGNNGLRNGSYIGGYDFTSPEVILQELPYVTPHSIPFPSAGVGTSIPFYATFQDYDGIENVRARIYNSTSHVIGEREMIYNATTGFWGTYITIFANWNHDGVIYIAQFWVRDNSGNEGLLNSSFLGGTDFIAQSIDILNYPVLHSVLLDKLEASSSEIVTLTINVTDAIEITSIMATLANVSLTSVHTFSLTKNLVSGLWEGSFTISSQWKHNGILGISTLTITEEGGSPTDYIGTLIDEMANFVSPIIKVLDKPDIINLSFSKPKIQINETFEIFIEIFDPDGIDQVSVTIKNYVGDREVTVPLTYDLSSDLWKTSMSLNTSWELDNYYYITSITILDNLGDEVTSLGYKKGFNGEKLLIAHFASPRIYYSEFPVVTQVNFKTMGTFHGDTVTIVAEVYDPDGVIFVDVGIYSSYYVLLNVIQLAFNTTSNHWEGSLYVDENWVHQGTIIIGDMVVEDGLNNRVLHRGDKFYSTGTFVSDEIKVFDNVRLDLLWFSENVVVNGQSNTAFAKISTGVDQIVQVEVNVFTENSEFLETISLNTQDNLLWSGVIELQPDWPPLIYIGSISLFYTLFYSVTFRGTVINGVDFTSPSFQIIESDSETPTTIVSTVTATATTTVEVTATSTTTELRESDIITEVVTTTVIKDDGTTEDPLSFNVTMFLLTTFGIVVILRRKYH